MDAMDTSPTDTLLMALMVLFWCVVTVAAALVIALKLHKRRHRRERRDTAREARRKFQAWSRGQPPDSKL